MINDTDQDKLLKLTQENGLVLEPIGQMIEARPNKNELITVQWAKERAQNHFPKLIAVNLKQKKATLK